MEPAHRLEAAYGLRKGTLREAYEAGLVRAQVRPGRGPTRCALWVRVEDVDARWGGQFSVIGVGA